MASSTNFKKLFEKYQVDGAPHGISIVNYCQMNGVVYYQFERWYKKCRAGVVLPVEIIDADDLMPSSEVPPVVASTANPVPSSASIAHVNLVFSNGLHVTHHNISYQALCRMIEKLEVLC